MAGDGEKAKMLATEFYTSTLPPVMRELDRRLEGREWFCGDKVRTLFRLIVSPVMMIFK